MTGTSYNGYDSHQRGGIGKAYKRGEAGPGFTFANQPCGLCGDQNRAPGEWHSEDYSAPFSFNPPQTYALCKSCHGRVHKRFNRPVEEWELFCRHIEAGGYGREFTALFPVNGRKGWCAAISQGQRVEVNHIRPVAVSDPWWRSLTLDPESLIAPWARPRPWRARPDAEAYGAALEAAKLTETEWEILRHHAGAYRRTVTMRDVAREALGSPRPQTANLAYGNLAKRISANLDWTPDLRENGTPFWLSVIAEWWNPPSSAERRREFELVMIPVLVELIGNRAKVQPLGAQS